MGAITFSLDPRLVKAIRTNLPLDVLVETGTFKGDTVALFLKEFRKIISIELSKNLSNEAFKRFESCENVHILEGNSASKLSDFQAEWQTASVLFWLDAHWCAATDTAGELSQCPLLQEIKAIKKLNLNSVVLIDDARLFLAPPAAPHEISHWPTFQEILNVLRGLSESHHVMVVNDVIAFFPEHTSSALESYAQAYGADWLDAANSYRNDIIYLPQLEEKEIVIQNLKRDVDRRDKLISEQEKTITAYESAYGRVPPFRVIARIRRRFIEIISPRLGNLNQYSPRPLTKTAHQVGSTLCYYPLISIVTPSFSQGNFIERTLLSVFNQKYKNLEYFVQDGGSSDGTLNVLKRYESNLAGWNSEKDGGQSQAINSGLKKTSGEIMAWLNSDDLLLPGALHTVADYFNRHPEVDVVYGNRLLIDENDMEIGRWIMPGHDSTLLSWVDYVPQETMFWRRRIWNKIGGQVDETFRFAMDWDLLVRFREAGANFAHVNQFLGAFRIHEQQKTSASINDIGHQEMDRIRKRVLGKVPSQREIKNAIVLFLIKHLVVDMKYRVKLKLR